MTRSALLSALVINRPLVGWDYDPPLKLKGRAFVRAKK